MGPESEGPQLIFPLHAIQRMFERQVTVDGVRWVLEHGETIERYPHDKPYPSRLILGWRNIRPLHLVVAEDSTSAKVILVTVYEPDRIRWENDFRRRRR